MSLSEFNFIAVVPARAASTRLPGKMLADIEGKPMIVLTAQQALQSQASAVYVATDDSSIYETIQAYQLNGLMTDPNHPSGTDRLAEVVAQLKLDDDTVLVNVQGDEPLIDPELINQVAQHLAAHPEADIATAAYRIQTAEDFFNPNIVKVVCATNQQALYFSRAPIPWARNAFAQEPKVWPNKMHALHHIGIYAYRASFLKQFPKLSPGTLEQLESLEQLRAMEHGYKIQVHLAQNAPHPGVDTAEDLEKVREFVKNQRK